MTYDNNAPATKGDLRKAVRQMNAKIRENSLDLMRHIDVRFEDFLHNAFGITNDQLKNHEGRIQRLEAAVK